MLQQGDTIGNWTVVEALGRGGMAQVWLVQHRHLGTRCALKQPLSLSDRARARIMREARIQANLRHANVVRVHDVLETPDGSLCLVMDLVQGQTLADLLRQGPLPRAVALQIFRDVVAGVIAAHDANIVHRDLKPANVLISGPPGHPEVRVTDFGLGKHLEGDHALTTSRGLLGSVPYMAPEQAQSPSKVGIRADIFSLGCILYELLTTQRAFPGEDVVDLVRRAQEGIWRRIHVPSRISMALEGCLAAHPARRIPNGRTLLAVLDGRRGWSLASLRLVRPQDSAAPTRPWPLIGFVLALVTPSGTVLPDRMGASGPASSAEPSATTTEELPAPAPARGDGDGSKHRDSQAHWIIAPSNSLFPGTVYWLPRMSDSVQCAYDFITSINTSVMAYWNNDHNLPASLRDSFWASGRDKCSHIVTARYPADDEGKKTVALVTAGCARGRRYGADPGGHVTLLSTLREDEMEAWFRQPGVNQEAGSLGQQDIWRYAKSALRCNPEQVPQEDEVSFGVACALDELPEVFEAEIEYDDEYDTYVTDLTVSKYTPIPECVGAAQVSVTATTTSGFVLEATVCQGEDRGRRFQMRRDDNATIELARLSGDAPDLCPPPTAALPSQTSPASP